MDDRDYRDDTVEYRERSSANSWSWLPLLLIPLFFVFGWVANDAFDTRGTTTGPEAGVGGAPFDTDATPTQPATEFDDPTPTGDDGLFPDDMSPTDSPDTNVDDELDVPVLEQ